MNPHSDAQGVRTTPSNTGAPGTGTPSDGSNAVAVGRAPAHVAPARLEEHNPARGSGLIDRQTAPVRIVIPTFRRMHLLGPLLIEIDEHLTNLTDPTDLPHGARVHARTEILVIDNDPAASARRTVAESSTRTVTTYLHEPRPGIGAVRARALEEVEPGSVIVFIDDDELPDQDWIGPLLRTWEKSGAEIVVGRVVPRYEEAPSAWIEAGGFFIREAHPTGTQVSAGATSNMLLDVSGVAALGLTFDVERGLHGGEDTLLTRGLHRAGGRILWCSESAVHDLVPAARANRRWVLARRYSHATTSVWVDLTLATSLRKRIQVRLHNGSKGTALMGRGLTRAAFGFLTGNLVQDARGWRDMARALGLITGAMGFMYEEYRRP